MKIFFDTEFIEDGKTIELLSIGMVREDGMSYYAEPAETDRTLANEWVAYHVIPELTGPIYPKADIARQIVEFVGPNPEFWAWYADYDWVALCQLYGTMMDLPETFPMYCRDFKQWVDDNGNPQMLKHLGVQHNALDDALWLKRNFARLREAA
jgi:hypothetical protein